MGFLNRFKKINYKERAEIMRSSCISFTERIGSHWRISELSKHKTDELEPLIFGMFIISNIYYSTKGDSETTRNQLESFNLIMDNFIVNDIILKNSIFESGGKNIVVSDEEVEDWNRYDSLMKIRHAEYGRLLQLDIITQKSSLFRNTIRAFVNNFISEEIEEDKLKDFIQMTRIEFKNYSQECGDIINQW